MSLSLSGEETSFVVVMDTDGCWAYLALRIMTTPIRGSHRLENDLGDNSPALQSEVRLVLLILKGSLQGIQRFEPNRS